MLIGWLVPCFEIFRPLRAVLLLLLVMLLSDPKIVQRSGGTDLWVLLDESRSAKDLVETGRSEWRTLLERSRPRGENDLHFLEYADEVIPVGISESALFPGNRDHTRTALAINDALARMNQQKNNRLLLFSDGFSTEPLTGVAEKLIESGVPLDYRLLRARETTDLRIDDFDMPARTQPSEAFVVELTVSGNADGPVPVEVFRGEKQLFSKTVEVKNGIGRLRFSDRITAPGAHHYDARILPTVDEHPGNNRFEKWIEVVAGPRIILVSKYKNDPLMDILKAQGTEVILVDNPLSLSPGILTGAKAVILNNVAAYELPNPFLNALPFFVNEQGGGLLMAGGHRSFGSGGYYESAVDPLLPVSLELKSEHRKLGVAMAIVMDRSGSMAMTTTSGHTKIHLANEGAARAVDLLGSMDALTVFAVDSAAHEITPLLNVGENRGELNSRIRSIKSMGGGIFVYTGMKAAWDVLKNAPLGQRHMILFSDAADSEEPGEYKTLLKEMTANGTTVSVIGLGTRADSDAAFLEDIATLGGGRIFFTENAGEIPTLFAQETVTVARSSFVEDPTGPLGTGRWFEIARRENEWLAEVDGYNLSYLREGDEMALASTDSYTAPLVAFGRRGIGRTAAVAFPLGGEFSDRTRVWPGMGDFVQTLTRWLMGDEIPPGIGIRHELTGSELSIDLRYDPEMWESSLSGSPPKILLQKGYLSGEIEALDWERLSPGHYQVSTTLREGEPVRGAVQIAGAAIPFGPITVGLGTEWKFDLARVEELRQTAKASGGEERLDLSKAWEAPRTNAAQSLRSPLVIAVIFLFLLEALITRTGWNLPKIAFSRARPAVGKREKRAPAKTIAPPEPPKAPVPEDSDAHPPENPSQTRKNRFNRAKKGI
jgi:uncharacterized membrane protein